MSSEWCCSGTTSRECLVFRGRQVRPPCGISRKRAMPTREAISKGVMFGWVRNASEGFSTGTERSFKIQISVNTFKIVNEWTRCIDVRSDDASCGKIVGYSVNTM